MDTVDDKTQWIPIAVLAIVLIMATGMWKMDKLRQPPLKRFDPAQAAKQEAPSKMEGKLAPDFALTTLDGKSMRLADYRGKIVFLNIWASWCAPCRDEMPSMQKLHDHFKGQDFAMLTITIDKERDKAEAMLKELNLTFPAAMDPEQTVAAQYQITGVPETFLIDKNGVVMHHLIGPGDWYNPNLIYAFEALARRPAESTSVPMEKTAPRQ